MASSLFKFSNGEEYKIDKEADIQEVIDKLTDEMLKYASQMEFEKAAELRDKIKELTGEN